MSKAFDESIFTTDRRRERSFKDWSVIIAMLVNVGGLVWTAAKSSAMLEQLAAGQAKNSVVIERSVGLINAMDIRLSIIEATAVRK